MELMRIWRWLGTIGHAPAAWSEKELILSPLEAAEDCSSCFQAAVGAAVVLEVENDFVSKEYFS